MSDRFTLLRRSVMILAVPGMLISAYLTWTHVNDTSVYCIGGSRECDIVQQSKFAVVAGVPIALLGLLGYLAIMAVCVLEETRGPFYKNGPLLTFAFTLIGFLYSAYLTYVEFFVIFAKCQYCIASALIMTVMFGVSIYRLVLYNELEQPATV